MNRKQFLRLTGRAGVAAPFLLNGFTTRASQYLEGVFLPPDCMEVSERAVVIVRLSGANDGLNNVIPISQYATYADIRPDINIKDSGTGAYLNLDSTLSDDKLTGLHPALSPFKSLYEAGKLALLPGVGYPNPNYSHFASENTIFAGKDGDTNSTLKDGIFGRYLGKAFPGLASYPTTQNPDPLAIHFGNSNPNLFYNHTKEIGIEYNLTNLQNQFFNDASFRPAEIPAASEHNDLLDFISTIEDSMDVYYNRISDTFTAGNNNIDSYPDSSLGNQLKMVARLLSGGSKTKVFQVTLGGFDTHVDQTEGGDTHLGRHANLLSDLATSIEAFQNDLAGLGIDQKIMTVTCSEFGRQVRQNSNKGTDHGNISPFYVIGKHAQAGVLSSHPTIPTTGFQYALSERKFDYRQIFGTLLRDWLGADDSTMEVSELETFITPEMKVPIVKTSQSADPTCLVGVLLNCDEPIETVTAVKINDQDDWTYYAPDGYTGNKYLLGIKHLGNGTGSNTAAFTAQVSFTNLVCDLEGNRLVHKGIGTSPPEGTFIAGSYYNINILSGSPNGSVQIRFFPQSNYLSELQTEASEFWEQSGSTGYLSENIYIKSKDAPFDFPADLRSDGKGVSQKVSPCPVSSSGLHLGYDYLQFNSISNFSDRGFAVMRRVASLTDKNGNFAKKGGMRFNTATSKFEGFNGAEWIDMN